jgi:mono/diheme cytochrome c family protein
MHFSYSADIKPILTSYCVGCHAGSSAQLGFADSLGNWGPVRLDSFSFVKDQVTSNIYNFLGDITQDPATMVLAMPEYGDTLSICNLAKIRKWITAGAPNN